MLHILSVLCINNKYIYQYSVAASKIMLQKLGNGKFCREGL